MLPSENCPKWFQLQLLSSSRVDVFDAFWLHLNADDSGALRSLRRERTKKALTTMDYLARVKRAAVHKCFTTQRGHEKQRDGEEMRKMWKICFAIIAHFTTLTQARPSLTPAKVVFLFSLFFNNINNLENNLDSWDKPKRKSRERITSRRFEVRDKSFFFTWRWFFSRAGVSVRIT